MPAAEYRQEYQPGWVRTDNGEPAAERASMDSGEYSFEDSLTGLPATADAAGKQ